MEGVKKPGDVVLHYIDTPRELRVFKFALHNQQGTPKCALVDIRGCVVGKIFLDRCLLKGTVSTAERCDFTGSPQIFDKNLNYFRRFVYFEDSV